MNRAERRAAMNGQTSLNGKGSGAGGAPMHPDITIRDQTERRKGALWTERASWDAHARELAQHLLPRSSRFFAQDRNRGGNRHNHIYDSSGIKASRILAAGMMSGATSPARPWMRVTIGSDDVMKRAAVKLWCSAVTKLMLMIFAESNVYRALHTTYGELGVFGTHSTLLTPDFKDVVRAYPMTFGEYAIAQDKRGEVDTIYRVFDKPVGAIVSEFGYANCSASVQLAYDRRNLDQWRTIVHALEPRLDRDANKQDALNMPFRSLYYEQGSPKNMFLRESGFNRFRGLCPRWQVTGGDIYGESPGMEALGDVKQLQHEQLRKAQGIDYMTKPPVQAPTSAKGQEIDLLPGGTSFVDSANPQGGLRSVFEVRLDLSHLLEDINDVRGRINSAFYADMFLMLAQSELSQPGVTATAVAEAHEEKLLMIGPVLERLHNELYSPLIDMTFDEIVRTGLLPPPPPEIRGMPLQVEYTSALFQAQKAVATAGVDRFVVQLGTLAGLGMTSVLDKFDSDAWADWYSDALGVDPSLITSDGKVALIRAQRVQAQQDQAKQAQAADVASTVQKLGTVPTPDGSNAGAAALAGINQSGAARGVLAASVGTAGPLNPVAPTTGYSR
jgi:hypothetical protein